MALSDRIEAFITELLREEENDWIELKRNELASVFNCVPSQINYVIQTRFTPRQGYIVESRRGGGGYLKIRKIDTDNIAYKLLCSIDNELDIQCAKEYIAYLHNTRTIDELNAKIMTAAVSGIKAESKDEIRAGIFKSMLKAIEGGN